MNKKLIWIIVVIIILVGAGIYFALNRQVSPPLSQIANFEECARAGYPVGESNPRQCWTPDGKHFVEELKQEKQLLAIEQVRAQYEAELMAIKGVVGVGIGECMGKFCIKVFLENDTQDLKNKIPPQLGGFKVDTEVTGPIKILPIPALPTSGPITISGEITCLSKLGRGAQTMECAIGLKGADGRYYALKNLFKLDPEYKFSIGGLRVEVSGIFSHEEIKGPDGNRYDVVGVIDVTSIKEITTSPTPPLSKSCFKTGCSGQICADSEVITTCEYRSEYECYQTTRCERQASGACGWTQSPELISCLAKTNQN